MERLQKYYSGFYIKEPVGNNAFSYQKRTHKQIYVPPLVEGELKELAVGNEIVFSEVDEGKQYNQPGLRQFVHVQTRKKEIFIFDNHNHAFFFWIYGLKTGKLNKGKTLLHVDQHSDMWKPERYLEGSDPQDLDLETAFEYTNFELNVGTFIKPALALNIFSELEIIDGYFAFDKALPQNFALDLDIDIFAKDMDYIDYDYKLEKIRNYIDATHFITIATSPYFIDQQTAIIAIKELLNPFV